MATHWVSCLSCLDGLWYYSIKTILREEFGIVSKFNFPQEGKRSGLPLPSYIIFSPLTAIFSWKNHKITQRKIQTWVPFRQKNQDKTFLFFFFFVFFLNLKITSLNKGDKYLSIKLRRKKWINGCWDYFFMEKVCVIFCTSESFCASWRHGCLSSPRKFICEAFPANGRPCKERITGKS